MSVAILHKLILPLALLGLTPLHALPCQDAGQDAGQETDQEPGAPVVSVAEAEGPSTEAQAGALADLREALAVKDREIEAKQAALQGALDQTSREGLEAELQSLHERREELLRRFSRLTSQADDSLFVETTSPPFDPQEKVFSLLKPVFDELEDMTSNSREISQLEEDLGVERRRQTEALKAVKNLKALADGDLEPDVRSGVDEQLELWEARLAAAKAQLSSIEYELGVRRQQQRPMIDTASGFIRGFVRTRGFHLLLGIAAFCAVFFGVRGLQALVSRVRRRPKNRRLSDRMAALLMHGLSVALGTGALLFVFNATGDWFLLGISLFFLAGAGWVIVKALPLYVEQIRLVLNMGAVKEGELLVFDDVSWRVQTLGFQAKLVSERLSGGIQVVPVRTLVGLHSRPLGDREELFPCEEGDWVSLDDGTIGCVDYQTPSVVQLALLGGSRKVYTTPSFLEQNPQNMSTNYRVEFTFGIDYKYQRDCTVKIPEKMRATLEAGLAEVLTDAELLDVDVEFKTAAASSLDYEVQIDVHGSAAAKYEDVERAASRLLVDACNENDWEIPFQQLTVHQAAEH